MSARSPACTFGCRVFTRPSRHSGKPVSSSTAVTGTPVVRDPLRRRAGRDDLHTELVQPRGELREPLLLVDAHQCPAHRPPLVALRRRFTHGMVTSRPLTVAPSRASAATVPTSNRRSSILMRSCRSSTVSPGRTSHGGLRQHRPGVHAVVDEVDGRAGDLDAVGERVGNGVRAGKGGQQRRVSVDHRAADLLQEGRSEDLHEPGADDEVGSVRDDGRGDRGVPRGAVGVRADRLDEGRDPRALGPGEPLDAGTIRSDGDDLRRVAGIGGRVQQCLEQRARTGHQHDDPRRDGQLHPEGAARLRHARLLGLTATWGTAPSLGCERGHTTPGRPAVPAVDPPRRRHAERRRAPPATRCRIPSWLTHGECDCRTLYGRCASTARCATGQSRGRTPYARSHPHRAPPRAVALRS